MIDEGLRISDLKDGNKTVDCERGRRCDCGKGRL